MLTQLIENLIGSPKSTTNPFVRVVKDNDVKVVKDDIIVELRDDATYISRNATVKITEKKKVEPIVFHDYMVRIGNKLYHINKEETGAVYSNGLSVILLPEKTRPYIIKDGKKLYINTDFRGNKVLQSS